MNIMDIIGPVMVGPSSSHTAGAVKIGQISRKLLAEPVQQAEICFHGSFLATGKGHGTDRALVAGLLGLACDPVAGLVEVPCIKRNVIGAVNALTASDMAMAGILSRIPPDEVIDAMRNIGRSMPSCLKETGEGGLAVTPTGMQIKEKMPNFM